MAVSRIMTRAMASSDSTAEFAAFFRAQQGPLFRALLVVTRQPELAEDLSQEAFVRVWRHWGRVRSMAKPDGYLFRTALHLFFDHERAKGRRVEVDPGVHDRIAQIEAKSFLERELLALPSRQRAALVLTELLGYKSTEAARILRIRAGTVRRLSSLARRRLRDRIGEEDEGA
jgi:RNA polymerase sigma-70 factor (ECF subfamily)